MANEITYHSAADTGLTLYAMLENTTGQLWNGSTLEAPVDANFTTYKIAINEAENTGIFRGDMPAVVAGTYSYVIRLQAEGDPAVDDIVLGGSELKPWDGSQWISLGTLQAEPGQGNPAATASVFQKISYLYKNWRNRKTESSTEFDLYADDGTTVDQKATVSDAAGVTTKGEMATGP